MTFKGPVLQHHFVDEVLVLTAAASLHDPVPIDFVKRQMAEKIAGEILRSGTMAFDINDSKEFPGYVYVGRVAVKVPKSFAGQVIK